MRAIKLMADYECFPLWDASSGMVGNIDPDSLPLTESLKSELIDWAKSYDETLDQSDPLNSGFKSDEDESAFKEKAYELADRLRRELGNNFVVNVQL